MSKLEHKKVMPRYSFFVVLMSLLAVAVIAKATYIMTVEKEKWDKVAARVKADNQDVAPARGNILSCDGDLLASTLPEYMIYMDFKTLVDTKTDTVWNQKKDSICMGLHEIFPSRSAEEFMAHLEKGLQEQKRHYKIWPKKIDYSTYTMVKKLPLFCMNKNRSGFHSETLNSRIQPNALAVRTVGLVNSLTDSARCGIELSFDSLLRGKTGIKHRRKTLNRTIDIIDKPAEDGYDIVSTIDIAMQDLAQRALLKELKLPQVNGEMGVAILMEVHTGDVKAIVNLVKDKETGNYYESLNNAINYRCEPGSVFKPASIMVALDDGVCDTSKIIHTGCGVWEIHGRKMKDHNWATQGGYQDINVARSLEVSSNIGVSWIIENYYAQHPEKYVEGLYRIGMHEDLQLPLEGYLPPIIRMPTKDKRGKHWVNWDKTTLPWMSIGYGTQIAPINTLTFYNAIANNGKMVRPRFVKQLMHNGEVVEEMPVEVIKERICKESTLKTMQTVLEHVVSQGLGKKAGSKSFKVAGKTGTAQVAKAGGYTSGTTGYWLSFAGYFPADAPKYSMIVCIKKWGLPASGGGMSGVVFKEIAEGVMSQSLSLKVEDSHSENSTALPPVKRGNILASDYVLSHLGYKSITGWNGSYATGNPIWGTAESKEHNGVVLAREKPYGKSMVPDVRGMGARDAVYLLEQYGVKVRLQGRGFVKEQSLVPGTRIRKGQVCKLQLEMD